jgi:hypothetical protein
MMLLKLLFILLLDVLWLGLVLSPMNVNAWGCPKMIFRPHPHGHRHPLCFSVTSTLSFLPTMGCAPSQSQARVGARGGRSSFVNAMGISVVNAMGISVPPRAE